MVKYASFLGCQIPMRIPSIEIASKKVFEKIGLEAVDLIGYSCCPEPVISRLLDKTAWLATSARNIVLAEELGLEKLEPSTESEIPMSRPAGLNATKIVRELRKSRVEAILHDIK